MTGRRNLKMCLTICSFLLALVSTATAATLHVNTSGSGGAYTKIQDAIDAAKDGDEIEVYWGTYNEAINFLGKAIRLYSFSTGAATIDGNGAYHVVQCVNGEGPGTVLEGFTITGGRADSPIPTLDRGAGMYNVSSSPTVINCTFSDNTAEVWQDLSFGQGGGMYNWFSHPTVTGCTFSHNRASRGGGGMYNVSSNPEVSDCTFSGNEAPGNIVYGAGGGMYNEYSDPTVTDCTFQFNEAFGEGGGMYNWVSSPEVNGCTFESNSTTFSAVLGMGNGGGMCNAYGNPKVSDCTFSGNSTGGSGAGMHNWFSGPEVTSCLFSGNTAEGFMWPVYGGGMSNMYSGAVVQDCTFSQNSAQNTEEGLPLFGYGGGMYNGECNPTVTNCTFSDNSANNGGGMWNSLAGPQVNDCTFSDNEAVRLYVIPLLDGFGGGMGNDFSWSTVTNCTFSGNIADWEGGGMYNGASGPSVTDCTFSHNWATNGGGMFNTASLPSVTNCIFSGNIVSNWGGGMGNDASYPTVTNCTFTANCAVAGGGISNFLGWPGGPTVQNCILWNNTPQQIYDWLSSPSVTYSDVQGGWGGTGNINLDPIFADPDGRLSSNSPCIDKGNNSAISGVATDRDGNPRIVDGNLDGDPRVDMGAYEAYEMLQTIRVPGDCATIQLAIDVAISYSSQIEVAPGTYNEAINFKGKAIRLYSTGGPQVTTINGTGKGYHVVQCVSGEFLSTILEGFTITGGNANGSAPHNRGGGMYNDHSSPTVTNCIFTGNAATGYGGGMSNDNWSGPWITGCIFKGNSAGTAGAGMANSENYSGIMTDCTFESNTASVSGGGVWNEHSSPRLTNCTFKSNRANALFGGGMHNELWSTVRLTNCTFSSNSAGRSGGGMNNYYKSTAILTNCTFTANSAQEVGGGMYNWGIPSYQSEAVLTNCTFKGNSVPSLKTGGAMGNSDGILKLTNCTLTGNLGYIGGGGIHNQSGSATLTNCILWGDSPPEIRGLATVTYSDVQGGWAGTGNKNANPMFADGAGRLSWGSPCIDAGNNAAVSVATDLDGKPRKTDGDLNGSAVVDMGAYEYVSVDADADGIRDSVDTAPLVYSNDFADGSTTGTIIDREDQLLVIADAPAPYGVWIEAGASGGSTPAHVSVCGNADIWFDAGDGAFVTCGSAEITVVQGTVEVVFTATDGTQVVTSLNQGNSIAFEPETCTITAPATNVDDIVVIVDGDQIILAPGESKTLVQVVDIDIYPNRTPNQVYLSRNYTLYVAILGSANFDVSTVDSSTVKFGRTGTEASPVRAPIMRDLNADGVVDAMYGFMTFDCDFVLGDTEGVLTGKTTAGIDIIGRDSVVVVSP